MYGYQPLFSCPAKWQLHSYWKYDFFLPFMGTVRKQGIVALHSTLYLLLMENVSCQLLSALANGCHHQWSNWAYQLSSCRNFSSCPPQEVARHHGGFILLTLGVPCAALWVMWWHHPNLLWLCACYWCNLGLYTNGSCPSVSPRSHFSFQIPRHKVNRSVRTIKCSPVKLYLLNKIWWQIVEESKLWASW